MLAEVRERTRGYEVEVIYLHQFVERHPSMGGGKMNRSIFWENVPGGNEREAFEKARELHFAEHPEDEGNVKFRVCGLS